MSWLLALPLLAQAAAVPRDQWVPRQVPEQLTDDEACAMFEDRVRRLAPALPQKLTHEKFRLRSEVDCAARIYRVEDEITVAPAAVYRGWQAAEQIGWNDEFCANLITLPLVWRGWRFVKEVSFPGGRKVRFEPKCA